MGYLWTFPWKHLTSTLSASNYAPGWTRLWWTRVCVQPVMQLPGTQERPTLRSHPAALESPAMVFCREQQAVQDGSRDVPSKFPHAASSRLRMTETQTTAAATLILLCPLACLRCRTVTLPHLVHCHRQQRRGRQCSDPNQPLQRSAWSCSLYSCSLCAATCSLWMAANPDSICASR